jgi:PAS domain-containing protein
MLNDDGIVLLANPAVGPMLGLLPDAMVGRSLLDVPGQEPLRHLFEQQGPRTAELDLKNPISVRTLTTGGSSSRAWRAPTASSPSSFRSAPPAD